MEQNHPLQILISNGSNRFHLAPLAVELNKAGVLAGMLTSGWPTATAEFIAKPFVQHPAVQRFLDRRERIPNEKVFASNFSEMLFQIGIRLRRISENTEQRFDLLGFYWYVRQARGVLRRLRPDLYHYRACYGLGSVPYARLLGIPAVCDHSIAHPGVLQYMIDHRGAWPVAPAMQWSSPLQRLMSRDIKQADHVLVNSDFVKETCVFSGVPAERVHVVYLGIDEKFFRAIPELISAQVQSRAGSPLLFAGGIQRRKGLPTLAEAFLSLPNTVKLRLIGGADKELESDPTMREFYRCNRVEKLGVLPRNELATRMTEASIFVFPSYCEGSARVIFEAMACGCFIITTPNSGSIVRDREHGLLVPPGDAGALASAIQWAVDSPAEVARIGWNNAQLVRTDFRQASYAEKVIGIYHEVLRRQR